MHVVPEAKINGGFSLDRMLALLLFLSLTLSQTIPTGTPCGGQSTLPPRTDCLPFQILPTDAPLATFAPGTRSVLVVGSRGNCGAVAQVEHAQGSSVTATTIEARPAVRQQLGLPPLANLPGVTLMELDLGLTTGPKSPSDFVYRYLALNNFCIPHTIYNCGLTVMAGNPEDYTEQERVYITNMYQNGWRTMQIEFEKFNNFPCNAPSNRTVVWMHSLSAGAFAQTSGVLELYYDGHTSKWNNIYSQNMKALLPNWRFKGVACTFTNTTNFLTEKNPSAVLGDTAQQQYLAVTTLLTSLIGVPLPTMGEAMFQAATQYTAPGAATVFQVLPGQIPNTNFTDWTNSAFRALQTDVAGGLYETIATQALAAGFQIDINEHGNYSLPFYTPHGSGWQRK
jgi:hypothetical protein